MQAELCIPITWLKDMAAPSGAVNSKTLLSSSTVAKVLMQQRLAGDSLDITNAFAVLELR